MLSFLASHASTTAAVPIMNPSKGSLTFSVLTLFFLLLSYSSATDTLAPGQRLRDGDVLISEGQKFALGFFSPGNSTRRYVGIWYHRVPELTVVWVANRDAPLNESSGFLSVTSKAGLVLYGHNGSVPVWSATVSDGNSSAAAQLLETGNLVLVRQDDRSVVWQSFDYPGDTFLPGMKLGMDMESGLNWSLTSWKSTNDPGKGNVSFRFDPTGFPEVFLYQGGVRLWRAGPWTGQRLSGVPEMTSNYIFRVMFVEDGNGFHISYNLTNSSIISRMMVDGSGLIGRYTWSEANRQWIRFWSDPKEQCDKYGVCGPNSNCDPYQADTFMCKCLPGFQPKSPSDWYLRDGSVGCVRDPGVSTCQTGEGFVKLARVRVPETVAARVNTTTTLKACQEECLRNCSCSGYAVADTVTQSGCLTWYGDLVDIRTYSSESDDIFVRVDAETLASYGKSKSPLANDGVKAIVIISAIIALFLLVCLVICCIRRRRKAKQKRQQSSFEFSQLSPSSTHLGESPSGKAYSEKGSPDLPFFDLGTIAAATNNFAIANKLGEGGFGSVYKGLLENGRDIAVKRLSKNSGQGVDEFRNEVTLIAKLQHRNLVRILGYCAEGEEKMLVYEYLPNNSLDSIIFDEEKRSQLDWPMRYNIICGIARGILYLHQDSRLRIIHRDLKASNVLLDASMNPKISDFGMAKIFGTDQIEANTMRIVGTYGYMSPEYAMHGIFSVKSDVYSFGVLLLEIIAGTKNRTYYESDGSTYLIGYTWELWKEGRALEIVDPTLGDSCPNEQASRCIQIGLLCVQESAAERPTMSSVVSMLSNIESALKPPGKPAFILKEIGRSGDPSTSEGAASINDVTITALRAR